MTRITNAEQVLLLLRAHLERARGVKRARTEPRRRKSAPLERVRALASTHNLSEAEVARALIAGLLTEEFGAAVAASPRFHGMVEDVRQVIERDETGRALLRSAITALTADTR